MSKWIAFSEGRPRKDEPIYICLSGTDVKKVDESTYNFNLKLFIDRSKLNWFWHPRQIIAPPTHIDLEGEEE